MKLPFIKQNIFINSRNSSMLFQRKTLLGFTWTQHKDGGDCPSVYMEQPCELHQCEAP